MKHIKILLIILIIPIILCSCKKEEHKLIELTAQELVQNLEKEDISFVFAVVDKSEDDYEEFLKDLENVVKSANIDIYYIDYLRMDTDSANKLIFNLYSTDFSTNGFHVIENGALIISDAYTDFKNLYGSLKDKIYTDKVDFIDNKTKKEYINKAKELYEEEKYAEAYDYLCKSWNLKEAKELYETHNYFHIINVWQHFTITNEEPRMITYRNLYIYPNINVLYRIVEKAPYDGYEKPEDLNKYEALYYKIENNIIYTAVSENSKYKETYKIVSVDKNSLKIIDLKTNEEFVYNERID